MIQVINMYRIPDSTAAGILKSRAQYNRCNEEVKISRYYRDKSLEKLSEEIQ